ncbi:hypothetical protein D9611_012568 [Ephemerocybe angulata]|uniref:Uncharacterized protein n=1 Tax=Ephemerocybe angulata TaxID=980116 RepID=A0A8H5ESZ8_9AGAR|nr:hypothetical protein D9611_012568 [Tulosesus angulatus]
MTFRFRDDICKAKRESYKAKNPKKAPHRRKATVLKTEEQRKYDNREKSRRSYQRKKSQNKSETKSVVQAKADAEPKATTEHAKRYAAIWEEHTCREHRRRLRHNTTFLRTTYKEMLRGTGLRLYLELLAAEYVRDGCLEALQSPLPHLTRLRNAVWDHEQDIASEVGAGAHLRDLENLSESIRLTFDMIEDLWLMGKNRRWDAFIDYYSNGSLLYQSWRSLAPHRGIEDQLVPAAGGDSLTSSDAATVVSLPTVVTPTLTAEPAPVVKAVPQVDSDAIPLPLIGEAAATADIVDVAPAVNVAFEAVPRVDSDAIPIPLIGEAAATADIVDVAPAVNVAFTLDSAMAVLPPPVVTVAPAVPLVVDVAPPAVAPPVTSPPAVKIVFGSGTTLMFNKVEDYIACFKNVAHAAPKVKTKHVGTKTKSLPPPPATSAKTPVATSSLSAKAPVATSSSSAKAPVVASSSGANSQPGPSSLGKHRENPDSGSNRSSQPLSRKRQARDGDDDVIYVRGATPLREV